jgi:hypothetical protein
MTQVRFHLEERDVLALHALRSREGHAHKAAAGSMWRLGLLLWMVVLGLTLCVQVFMPGDWSTKIMWVMVWGVGAAVLAVGLVLVLPRLVSGSGAEEAMIKSMFKKGDFGPPGVEVVVSLRDDGIHSATPAVETLARWSHVDRVLHSPELIAATWGSAASIAVPARAFASAQEMEAFREEAQRRRGLTHAGRNG